MSRHALREDPRCAEKTEIADVRANVDNDIARPQQPIERSDRRRFTDPVREDRAGRAHLDVEVYDDSRAKTEWSRLRVSFKPAAEADESLANEPFPRKLGRKHHRCVSQRAAKRRKPDMTPRSPIYLCGPGA